MWRLFKWSWLVLLLSGTSALSKPSSGKPSLDGLWDTPGGRVRMVRKGNEVTGTLVKPADGVKLAAGKQVITGIFEDDNLSTEIPVDLVAPTCHDDAAKAFAVLLLTRTGKLTGGVSSKNACAAAVPELNFQRIKDQTGKKTKAEHIEASATAGQYDTHGVRTKAMQQSLKTIMYEGMQYMTEGKFEKARELFQKVLKEDPTIGEAFNGMGATYAMRNDYEKAIDWYKQGLEAAPGFGDLYYNLACAYAQLNKIPMALRYLKLAVTKGYKDVENMDTDTDLEELRKDPGYAELRKTF